MSGLTRSPKLMKGAIIAFDPLNPMASVVIFQYNPNSLSRSLQAKTAGSGGSKSEVMRLTGAPDETISVKVHIDAADQLEMGDPIAATMGIHPQLSALEMLIYPKSASVIMNAGLLAAGTMEVVPPEVPFTLFIWGPSRILPVNVTSITVNEQAFDPLLNPILAEVDLSLRVLSYNDFPLDHAGFSVFLSHQIIKETMAVIGSATGAVSASVKVSVG